jgi:hypothetical protein
MKIRSPVLELTWQPTEVAKLKGAILQLIFAYVPKNIAETAAIN